MITIKRRTRPALLTRVALLSLVLGAGTAQAESLSAKDDSILGRDELARTLETQAQTARLLADAADTSLARQTQTNRLRVDTSDPEPEVVIAVPGTPVTARDPVNITGIGQVITDTGGGFIGTCTGTLINPRTVLFAAHCVNDIAATEYGANSGGVAIGVGFETNTRANAAGQTDELVRWLLGGSGGAGQYQTNTANAFYNVDFVAYNPFSLEPDAVGFLYGDVAIAGLDTPAAGIPTWSMLFSQLPGSGQITAASGTGYHVTIAGYGQNGTGAAGVTGSDYRRRIAENYIGALTSLYEFERWLSGSSDSPTQNLYFLDFDDPARGTSGASQYDVNLFRDNALAKEGITAPGDSGGPLILDQTFSRQLVIGVLSGGYPRFFNGQTSYSYGAVSFYQPLYLYWDWIAANNPYRYVEARAGNGNWEDASHWVSVTDPNYYIIGPDGQVVNGVPDQLGEQKNGTSGQFGQSCYQVPGYSECYDYRTGESTINTGPIGSDDRAQTSSTAIEPQNSALALPAPTIANGLPGATDFVPNNTPGIRTEGVLPRYFDVTLSSAGTTTLSSNVTIDRLTVSGSAGLAIVGTGRLTSLIDITQRSGTVTVNGALATPGDYLHTTGLLQGTGTISTPYLTSIAGTIAPGTVGTVGTLSLNGNLVLASANLTRIDIAGATSDRIAVTGSANVGGLVSVDSGLTGQVNGLGRQYAIVTATDGVTGAFTASTISPILSQEFTYQPNAVLLQIEAASYNTVVDTSNPVQRAYAQLVDQNRSNTALAGLYGLDFASVDTIRSTFDSLAPVNEQAVLSLAAQTVNVIQNFNDARLRGADRDRTGGKIAITGQPLELAQASLSPMQQPLGGALMAMQEGGESTELKDANLPENLAVYLAGGYVYGSVGALPGYARSRNMDGYYIAGGVEYFADDATMLGVSGYYGSLDADTPLGQRTDSDTYAASLYVRHRTAGGPIIDGQVTVGSMGFDTRRTVQFLGSPQTLASSSDNLMISGVLGLSFDVETRLGTISPGFEARYASVELSTVRETGGTLGLAIARDHFRSAQSRIGLAYTTKGEAMALNASAQVVFEFEKGPTLLAANFVEGLGPNANFLLERSDSVWGELGASAVFGKGPLTLSAGFDSTVGRANADAQVVRGSATYRF